MGFFSKRPNRVTPREWAKKIKPSVYGKLNRREEADLEKLLVGKMKNSELLSGGRLKEGLSREEVDSTINWLKANPKKHSLEQDDIALIESKFNQHLKD